MKKNILYLMAFFTLIFAACDPLEKTYKEIEDNSLKKDITLALTNSYSTVDAANTGIAATLNTTYAQLKDGSKAFVTYGAAAPVFKPADSLLATVPVAPATQPTQYTVTDADYAAINGNAFKNFSAAKVVQFLDTKFPVKVENQLIVLNYVYFESGVTTSAGVAVTETFLYLNAAWTKAYHVSQAQYISAGKLTVFNFAAADEANLAGYFNTFLKSDASVAAKAKAGDLKYVSFAYFASSKNYQRIKVLIFDGLNWVTKGVTSAPLTFIKKAGKWIPDPTVYYTLIRTDYNTIGASTAGTAAGRANLAQFGSFDVTGGANSWTEAQIADGLIVILNAKYPNAPVDPTVPYNITYALFRGATPTGTKSFVKAANGFVLAPAN